MKIIISNLSNINILLYYIVESLLQYIVDFCKQSTKFSFLIFIPFNSTTRVTIGLLFALDFNSYWVIS